MALTLTIYQALTLKLGRTPTDAEVKADVKRIIHDGRALRVKLGRTPTSAEVKADVQRIIHEGTQAAKR